jgi:hypothetical protein
MYCIESDISIYTLVLIVPSVPQTCIDACTSILPSHFPSRRNFVRWDGWISLRVSLWGTLQMIPLDSRVELVEVGWDWNLGRETLGAKPSRGMTTLFLNSNTEDCDLKVVPLVVRT